MPKLTRYTFKTSCPRLLLSLTEWGAEGWTSTLKLEEDAESAPATYAPNEARLEAQKAVARYDLVLKSPRRTIREIEDFPIWLAQEQAEMDEEVLDQSILDILANHSRRNPRGSGAPKLYEERKRVTLNLDASVLAWLEANKGERSLSTHANAVLALAKSESEAFVNQIL